MKIAVVTGVMGGIGKACAKALIRAGYGVAGMDVVPEPGADALAELPPAQFKYIKGDLADRACREALIGGALEWGELAALVNVAGVAPKVRRDILEMTEESYDFVMGVNTKGTLFLSQLVARQITVCF